MNRNSKTQDRILVHRALTRTKGGATRLVARYSPMGDLNKLRDIEQFRAWLMTIAKRAIATTCRWRRSRTARASSCRSPSTACGRG